jgi:hypothetical protein
MGDSFKRASVADVEKDSPVLNLSYNNDGDGQDGTSQRDSKKRVSRNKQRIKTKISSKT